LPPRQKNTYIQYSAPEETTVRIAIPTAGSELHMLTIPTEWTELNTLQAVFSATSRIATSLILGADHADAAEITAVSMGHNDGIMLSRVVRSAYPRILRPLVWRFAPTCRELQSNAARLRRLMIPEINRRVERVRTGKTPSNAEDTSFSLLDVLIEATFKNGTLSRTKRKENEDELVDIIFQQLLLYHFELSRPTGMNVVFMLYTIMNNRGYIAALRDEWAAAVNHCGGDWTLDILSHAPKLESFSKESFRYHDVSYCMCPHPYNTPGLYHSSVR
jgi:hypothetical protein